MKVTHWHSQPWTMTTSLCIVNVCACRVIAGTDFGRTLYIFSDRIITSIKWDNLALTNIQVNLNKRLLKLTQDFFMNHITHQHTRYCLVGIISHIHNNWHINLHLFWMVLVQLYKSHSATRKRFKFWNSVLNFWIIFGKKITNLLSGTGLAKPEGDLVVLLSDPFHAGLREDKPLDFDDEVDLLGILLGVHSSVSVTNKNKRYFGKRSQK